MNRENFHQHYPPQVIRPNGLGTETLPFIHLRHDEPRSSSFAVWPRRAGAARPDGSDERNARGATGERGVTEN